MGARKDIVGIVVPSGYSFNLDGTSIYLTMAAIFIAQALGIELSLKEELTLLAVLLLTSKGAAGVTGSGFVTLAATLATIPTIPVAGIALILGVDRFMSEARALTNLVGNSVATIVVASGKVHSICDASMPSLISPPSLKRNLSCPTTVCSSLYLRTNSLGERGVPGEGKPFWRRVVPPPGPPTFPKTFDWWGGGSEEIRSGGSWKRHFPRRRYGWDSPVFPVC